jgi:hypothetical protein
MLVETLSLQHNKSNPQHILDDVLSTSNNEIYLIKEYLRSCDVFPVPFDSIQLNSSQQYFLHNNLAYPLSEAITHHIDVVRSDLTQSDKINKLLKSKPLQLQHLRQVFPLVV